MSWKIAGLALMATRAHSSGRGEWERWMVNRLWSQKGISQGLDIRKEAV